ncbi:MFS transporter [Paenibacillus lautus]|uniref:MFS transporter n=1 Tax=Paenibacillus lautus TaxID=1401 RepID=UPI003D2990C9
MSTQQKLLTINLFLLTFVLGTSEFVIVGLLAEVASGLNIMISTAGVLVSAFAITFAIGTPVLTAIFSRYSKYPLMLILISVFIAGNIMTALSSSYLLLLLSRIITAIVTGVLIALAMAVGSGAVSSEKRGTVISIIFTGFTVASVIGVPLGTFIGQRWGWQASFWFTALLGVISLIASSVTIPKGLKGTRSALKKQIGLLTNPRIIIAFFIPALSIAATYTVYTYLTPLLQQVLAVPDQYISLVFLLYGVVSILSTLIGGKLALRNGLGKLRIGFLIQAVILLSLYYSSNSVIGGLISISFIALVVYTMNSTIQLYFIDLADQYDPSAKDLASSLTPVSINVGIALGSGLGGLVTTNIGLIDVSWVGAIIAIAASMLTFISFGLNRKRYSV